MGFLDFLKKKPSKEDVEDAKNVEVELTETQVGSNTTSSMSSANGYQILEQTANDSYARTTQILAGRDAQEKVATTYSNYAETVIISSLDRAFANVRARAKYINGIDEVTLGDVSREIQGINDLMQEMTQLEEQDRFDPESIASLNTKDYSKIYLSRLLEESEKHLTVLKSRYRSEPTTTRENLITEMTEEFQKIDDMLKGKAIDKKTSKVEEEPTISDDERFRLDFFGLAKSAEKRVDSDLAKTQEKPTQDITLDDLLNGPML